MSIFSSYKKIFLLGFIITILLAIPLSVYVAQKRQQTITKAAASTILSFDPVSTKVKEGDIVSLYVTLDPGTGTSANQVSFVKLSINYDSSKFATFSGSLTPNPESANALKYIIDDAKYDSGKASISLSIGSDPTYAIKTKTKIAIFQLRATGATVPTDPNFTFDSAPNTQVLSITASDQTSENVLSTTIPAKVTVIAGAGVTPTLSPSSTVVPTGFPSLPTPTPKIEGLAPVCLSMEVNATSGAVLSPFTFTAAGNDPDGTIDKISFNFGDSAEDLIIQSTKRAASTSGQMTHTYNAPGIYTTYAILTDNNNNLSAQQTDCTKTITVNPTDIGESPFPQPTLVPLEPPGNGKVIFGLGTLGIIITIIGGVLLLL